MTKKFLPFLAMAAALLIFSSAPGAPVSAAPSPIALPEIASPVESVRWRWRGRRHYSTGIGLFTVPGLYWGPAWWDPNYSRLCWRQIQPCRNCARNLAYTC